MGDRPKPTAARKPVDDPGQARMMPLPPADPGPCECAVCPRCQNRRRHQMVALCGACQAVGHRAR